MHCSWIKNDYDQLVSLSIVMQESLDSVTGNDAPVILCLQDFREELASQQCRDEVHKVTKRASEDIRFDESLADACYDDRARFCEGIQPVSF